MPCAKCVLRIDRGADKVCNIAAPRTGLEAKFSLRLTMAMALAGIDTASLGAYGDGAMPPIRASLPCATRCGSNSIDGWPASRAAMRVELVSGRSVEAEHDSGVPAADVAAQGRRIEAKFMSLAAPVIGEAQAGASCGGRAARRCRLDRGSDGARRRLTWGGCNSRTSRCCSRCSTIGKKDAPARAMPRRRDIDPLDMPARLLPHVELVELGERGRLRLALVGTAIVDALGKDATGRYLDQAFDGETRQFLEDLCRAALRERPAGRRRCWQAAGERPGPAA